MPPTSQDQIRERAYALWEAAGQPHGQDLEFWAMAETELTGQPDAAPKKRSRSRKVPVAAMAATAAK